MAGSGRRVFKPGEVLTASNVMNYLQDQAVQVYAGTAARGSAIGTAVAEGMVSYLKDAKVLEVYNGTVWDQPNSAGHVVQVQKVSNGSSYSTTTTTPVSIGMSISFIPKYSNSVILLNFTAGMVRKTGSAGGSWLQGLIFKDGSGVGDFSYGYGSSDNYTGGYMGPMAAQYFDTSGSTTARTYEIKIVGSGVGTQWVESLKVLTIWEIAQ